MLEHTGILIFLPPYYKYLPSKVWKEYCQLWDTMFDIAGQLVVDEHTRLQQNINNSTKSSIDSTLPSEELDFLPYVLSRGDLTIDEITGNLIDLMLGGLDTVIYFITYPV